SAFRWYGPDVAVGASVGSPVGNALPMRGPLRLHCVPRTQQPPMATDNIDGPKLAERCLPVLGAYDALVGIGDLASIRRPRWIIPRVGETPGRFAFCVHHVNSAAAPL